MIKRTKVESLAIAVIILITVLATVSFNSCKDGNTSSSSDEVGKIYFSDIDSEHISETENGIMFADNELLLVVSSDIKYDEVEKLVADYDAEIVIVVHTWADKGCEDITEIAE